MPAFSPVYGCTSTDGLDYLLSGDATVRHMPRLSQRNESNNEDIAAGPVHAAVPGLHRESGKPAETSPELRCEPGHVAHKSVHVRLLTCHEASQTDEKKILSTSGTQTEPQAVSSATKSGVLRSPERADFTSRQLCSFHMFSWRKSPSVIRYSTSAERAYHQEPVDTKLQVSISIVTKIRLFLPGTRSRKPGITPIDTPPAFPLMLCRRPSLVSSDSDAPFLQLSGHSWRLVVPSFSRFADHSHNSRNSGSHRRGTQHHRGRTE